MDETVPMKQCSRDHAHAIIEDKIKSLERYLEGLRELQKLTAHAPPGSPLENVLYGAFRAMRRECE